MGDLAKKTGTIVEDIVYSNISGVIQKQFGLEADTLMLRTKCRLKDGRTKIYDAIAIAGDKFFLNSTKSTIRPGDVKDLLQDIRSFRDFLPEYAGKKIIGILASLNVDESIVRSAEKKGFLVLAIGYELMEGQNSPGFRPKEY